MADVELGFRYCRADSEPGGGFVMDDVLSKLRSKEVVVPHRSDVLRGGAAAAHGSQDFLNREEDFIP
jgi:hypothetical protein